MDSKTNESKSNNREEINNSSFLFNFGTDWKNFQTYLEDNGVTDLLNHIVTGLFVERPEDPVEFIRDHVNTCFASGPNENKAIEDS